MGILWGAPNGSEMNKIERSMSLLNLPLAHMTVKWEQLTEWTEYELKNCSTMQVVREIGKKLDEILSKSLAVVERLEADYHSLVATKSGG